MTEFKAPGDMPIPLTAEQAGTVFAATGVTVRQPFDLSPPPEGVPVYETATLPPCERCGGEGDDYDMCYGGKLGNCPDCAGRGTAEAGVIVVLEAVLCDREPRAEGCDCTDGWRSPVSVGRVTVAVTRRFGTPNVETRHMPAWVLSVVVKQAHETAKIVGDPMTLVRVARISVSNC